MEAGGLASPDLLYSTSPPLMRIHIGTSGWRYPYWRGVSAEQLGEEAGRALRADLQSGAGVDLHAADQLLIYAALAGGGSHYTARALSLHAETAMWLIAPFLPVRFRVSRQENLACIDVLHAP